jgi:hypothetical protein
MSTSVPGIFTQSVFSGVAKRATTQKAAAAGFAQIFTTMLAHQMHQSMVGDDVGPMGIGGGASGHAGQVQIDGGSDQDDQPRAGAAESSGGIGAEELAAQSRQLQYGRRSPDWTSRKRHRKCRDDAALVAVRVGDAFRSGRTWSDFASSAVRKRGTAVAASFSFGGIA